ncbi:MAG: HAMP domain-containing sensor histidine kinase [Lachnospiraceae bacterium]|nr:HAMP domain-containing sensor histidine kinase [Lachnospiraceae bacterium]
MKLVTKIFLQVFTGFFFLSQMIFFYTLSEAQKESLNDIRRYEASDFGSRAHKLDVLIQGQKRLNEDEALYQIGLKTYFRDIFGENAALYLNGKELYNITKYEFDSNKIGNQIKSVGYWGDFLQEDEKSLYYHLNGRRLLILYYGPFEDANKNSARQYGIIWYKDVTEIYERTNRMAVRGIFFTIAAMAAVGGVLYLSLRRTMRPLQELKSAAADIAGGAYDSRVPVRRKDEIGELAISFNQMSDQVRMHVAALSRTNETQRQLLASLAHELKTPMTAIIGFSDTLMTLRLSEERKRQALTYIGSECRRLSRLSVKMLELTGLYETEEEHISMEMVAVGELLEQVRILTAHRLQEKQIKLIITNACPDLKREMDRDLMISFLLNLVDNAAKASAFGGKIEIFSEESSITVKDYGKGIPAEELEHVTEAFYMVDKSRARSEGSIGLGLALCRQIARLHGAGMRIESEAGVGTSVVLSWKEAAGLQVI